MVQVCKGDLGVDFITILSSLLPIPKECLTSFILIAEMVNEGIREKSVKFTGLLLALIKSEGLSREHVARIRVLAEGTRNVSSEGLMVALSNLES